MEEEALSEQHQQNQCDKRQKRPVDEFFAHIGENVHLPLYAQQRADISLAVLERNKKGDMGIRLYVSFVAHHDFPVGILLNQRTVFLPVFIVGGFPQITEIVSGVFGSVVNNRENKLYMGIIGRIGNDDINEGRAGGIAQPVKVVPHLLICLALASALQVIFHLVGVDILRRGLGGKIRAFRVLLKQCVRKNIEAYG